MEFDSRSLYILVTVIGKLGKFEAKDYDSEKEKFAKEGKTPLF